MKTLSDIQGDPQFAALPRADQASVLEHVKPGFSALKPEDQDSVIQHLTGGSSETPDIQGSVKTVAPPNPQANLADSLNPIQKFASMDAANSAKFNNDHPILSSALDVLSGNALARGALQGITAGGYTPGAGGNIPSELADMALGQPQNNPVSNAAQGIGQMAGGFAGVAGTAPVLGPAGAGALYFGGQNLNQQLDQGRNLQSINYPHLAGQAALGAATGVIPGALGNSLPTKLATGALMGGGVNIAGNAIDQLAEEGKIDPSDPRYGQAFVSGLGPGAAGGAFHQAPTEAPVLKGRIQANAEPPIGLSQIKQEANTLPLKGEPYTQVGDFITGGHGHIDLHVLPEDVAAAIGGKPLPVRLQPGEHIPFPDSKSGRRGSGYGLKHIETAHGKEIREAGFKNPEEFVDYVLNNYNEVYNQKNGKPVFVVRNGRSHYSIVQLQEHHGGFYGVTTAFPEKPQYIQDGVKGRKLAWSGRNSQSQVGQPGPAVSATLSSKSDQVGSGAGAEANYSHSSTPEKTVKPSSFVNTVKNSTLADKDLKDGIEAHYEGINNKETLLKAQAKVKKDPEAAYDEVKNTDEPTAETYALAQDLMRHYQNEGNYERAIELAEHVSGHATKQGQAIQALSMWGRLTPEGALVAAERIAKKTANPDKVAFKELQSKYDDVVKALADERAKRPVRRQRVKELSEDLKGIPKDNKIDFDKRARQIQEKAKKMTFEEFQEAAKSLSQDEINALGRKYGC